jgi:hypothetical protein
MRKKFGQPIQLGRQQVFDVLAFWRRVCNRDATHFLMQHGLGPTAIASLGDCCLACRRASLQQFVDRVAAWQDWDWATCVGDGVS